MCNQLHYEEETKKMKGTAMESITMVVEEAVEGGRLE